MAFKINIIEPWEAGTEKSIKGSIIKDTGKQFLLRLDKPIQFKGTDAQYFICEFRNDMDKASFKEEQTGNYPINMVFDKNITEYSDLPSLSAYRSNFLLGELVLS
jgi:hypothetical protein